jgi:hypothetical protein
MHAKPASVSGCAPQEVISGSRAPRCQRPLPGDDFGTVNARSWPTVAGDDSTTGVDPKRSAVNVGYAAGQLLAPEPPLRRDERERARPCVSRQNQRIV